MHNGARGAEALATHRQEQEQEAARLRSLRAAGVEDEHAYAAVDWDAPHGAWLVPVQELLHVASPDVTSGRAERGAFEKARGAQATAAADEALELMAAELRRCADDMLDEQEMEIEGAEDEAGEVGGGESLVDMAASAAFTAPYVTQEAMDEMVAELQSAEAPPIQPIEPELRMHVAEGQADPRIADMLQRAEDGRRASNEARIGEQQWATPLALPHKSREAATRRMPSRIKNSA
jgi:hypothetical protein